MLNKAILMGRLTRDPELRHTQSNMAVCSFSLAIDRGRKDQNGERQTDFIFAAFAEEFGFVGTFTLLACYAAIILISLRIASLSHSHFGRLGTLGVTATFALYVLINGAMVMGLAPVVGVPMPLLSYGGSTMMTVMIGFGLILSTHVHRYVELPKGQGLF